MKSLFIILFILVAATAKAQTENTSERLITQLKNGTAPGLVFNKNAPAIKPVIDTEQKESLIAQIRKGNAPGMKFMTGSPTANAARIAPANSRTQSSPLASELEIKKETLKINTAPPIIPTQEEVKKEAENGKQ